MMMDALFALAIFVTGAAGVGNLARMFQHPADVHALQVESRLAMLGRMAEYQQRTGHVRGLVIAHVLGCAMSAASYGLAVGCLIAVWRR